MQKRRMKVKIAYTGTGDVIRDPRLAAAPSVGSRGVYDPWTDIEDAYTVYDFAILS